MKSKLLLSFLILCNSLCAYSQNYTESNAFLRANSHWIFGDSAGINFNASPTVGITSNNSGDQGSAAVSDPVTGELLFYSNGAKCWKANGQVMLHGDSLLGNKGMTMQGVCIVPFPNDSNKFYLFSMADNSGNGRLYYSIVDMELDNGEGDIDSTRKNISLGNIPLSEAMIAVPGECNDIWLLLHHYKLPEFIAYHITDEGIDTTPVISTIGNAVPEAGAIATYQSMAISPDRQKIAIIGDNMSDEVVLLAEFDPATAAVSNMIKVLGVSPYRVPPYNFATEGGSGICFSPDNSKLYVTTEVFGNFTVMNPFFLYQFDISVYDSAAIANSKYTVYEKSYQTNLQFNSVGLRLYKDTIYICVKGGNLIPTLPNPYGMLNSINQPNVAGSGCDYTENTISIAPGAMCLETFGNDVVYPLIDTVYQHLSTSDTTFCSGGAVTLHAPTSYQGIYSWSDGSDDSTLQVEAEGTYWVTYRDRCYNVYVDTFVVEELPFLPPVIQEDNHTLSTTQTYEVYQWLLDGTPIAGATGSIYEAIENGDYQVVTSNEYGCSDTSGVYTVDDITGIPSSGHFATSMIVYPNPTQGAVWIKSPAPVYVRIATPSGRTIREYSSVTSFKTDFLVPGMYFVTISDVDGNVLKVEKLIKSAR